MFGAGRLFSLCNIIASETTICVLCKLGHVIYQLNMDGRIADSCGLSCPSYLIFLMLRVKHSAPAYRGTERRVEKQSVFCKHIYFHVIHNINKTHNIKCYNLMVLGYMFRPHCGHFQANSYRLSALNVRTIWDPIVEVIYLLHADKI